MSYLENVMTHAEDICVWPDNDWCFRDELSQMTSKSDDFFILTWDTPEYNEFLKTGELS